MRVQIEVGVLIEIVSYPEDIITWLNVYLSRRERGPLGGGRVELRTTTPLAPSPMGEFFVADEITPWGWHGEGF